MSKEKIFDFIIDLLIDFDEMGFAPTTTVPDPDAYAIEWKNKLTNALEDYRKQSENAGVTEAGEFERYRAEAKELKCAYDRCNDEKNKIHVMYEETLVKMANLEKKIEHLSGECEAYRYCLKQTNERRCGVMREILFRGKTKYGEWKEGYYTKHIFAGYTEYTAIEKKEVKAIYGQETEYAYMSYEVIPETVGQYTGLTDKNGKKIFEGDIIKSCEYDDVYSVKYCADDDYPAFDVVPEINIECNGLSHLYIVEGVEVIGNIHDNPELLKGGE